MPRRRLRPPPFVSPVLICCALPFAALACGDDGAGVEVPALRVTTATTGTELDPDGYTVSIDGQQQTSPIGLQDTLTVEEIAEGDHTVLLAGLAENCVAEGSDPRTVRVTRGETAEVAFGVACSATSGVLQVAITTTGTEPDADGYTVTVEGLPPFPVGTDTTVTLAGVATGPHAVRLDGVAPNCTLGGENPQSAAVPGGDTAVVTFEVVCAAITGQLVVTAATTGESPDPDGYTVAVDAGAALPLGVNDSLTISALSPGTHTVRLGRLAGNCRVTGDNPITVAVTAGAASRADFTVDCPTPRVARWTPMPSGTNLTLVDVWGASATDVFTVGQSEVDFEGTILHYDGGSWSELLGRRDIQLEGVWGSSPGNVYAVGFVVSEGPTQGIILHSTDGRSWVPEKGPEFEPFVEVFFNDVWGTGPNNIFVTGTADLSFGFSVGVIAHFDGSSWQLEPIEGPESLDVTGVWADPDGTLYAVGNVFPFDADEETAIIFRRGPEGWARVLDRNDAHLNAVSGDSRQDVYAVGFRGQFPRLGLILHFDGNAWTFDPASGSDALFDVWAGSPADVFIVGTQGTILRRPESGAGWTKETPTRNSLFGVWGSGPGDVFAVGRNGTILHGTP